MTEITLQEVADAVDGFRAQLLQDFAMSKGFNLLKGDKLYIPVDSGLYVPRKLKGAVVEHPLCPEDRCIFVKGASLNV